MYIKHIAIHHRYTSLFLSMATTVFNGTVPPTNDGMNFIW